MAKKKLQTIYYVTYMEDGIEAMFDKDAKLLGYWYANDAAWRSEYFNPFLEELGYTTEYSEAKKFKKKLKEIWDRDQGCDSSEEYEDDDHGEEYEE